MNEVTRGYIESLLDGLIKVESIVENVKWIEEETPIKSLSDLSLGYMIGGGMAIGAVIGVIAGAGKLSDDEKLELRLMLKRRLPEILQKINSELHV